MMQPDIFRRDHSLTSEEVNGHAATGLVSYLFVSSVR
jgi:hypothetical protein